MIVSNVCHCPQYVTLKQQNCLWCQSVQSSLMSESKLAAATRTDIKGEWKEIKFSKTTESRVSL